MWTIQLVKLNYSTESNWNDESNAFFITLYPQIQSSCFLDATTNKYENVYNKWICILDFCQISKNLKQCTYINKYVFWLLDNQPFENIIFHHSLGK